MEFPKDSIFLYDNIYNNFDFFLEEGYIKIYDIFNNKNIFLTKNLKINLTIGKQKIFYDDGFIINDDNNGFFGYKIVII